MHSPYTEPNEAERLKDAIHKPTFMYTMPLGKLPNDAGYRVFFEETSLVGRDERRLSFEECKERCMKRLAFHGIDVLGIEEEEYCYIPMGGELPDGNQVSAVYTSNKFLKFARSYLILNFN